MDWIILVHLLTELPAANQMQAQSHYMAGFTSEKLCNEAVAAFQEKLSGMSKAGTSVTVRAVCVPRKEAR